MRLFDTEVQKGQRICREVKVGELACFSDIKIPVLAVRGMHEGPTLWLTGAVHGDELNGPWAMRRFFWDLDPAELHGNLVLTPLLNPMAFQVNDKISHLDYLDLDQQFPGNAGGSYSERVACAVFTELKSCANYVIDFHTMGHPFSAVPYTVSKIVPGSSEETVKAAFAMARVFGVYPNCRVDLASASGELPGTTGGAIDILCMRNNVPCFMAEMGGGSRWDEAAIQTAYQGIRNVMTYLKMLAGEYPRPGKQLIITKRRFPRSNRGGLVRMAVTPGTIVRKGQLVATICNFWEDLEQLVAEQDWFMIATRFQPVVSTGDRMGFIGYEWHEQEWQEADDR